MLVDDTTRLLLQRPFEALPAECKARAYGTDYARIILSTGGELYLTRYGWALNSLVVPNAWFVDARYRRQGRRLPNSTGTVYRVPSVAPIGATDSIVVKFSRVAQDVPIFIDRSADPEVGRLADTASFNDPFEEIATVMRLRRGPFAPDRPRILTKRPLAIYSPPNRYELWQLGRKEGLFAEHAARLEADQEGSKAGLRVSMDLTRDYILLFQWVKGLDTEAMHAAGALSEDEMTALYHRSMRELGANGFIMLDNKPRHLILRLRRNGRLLRRRDALTYALIDFELLKPRP